MEVINIVATEHTPSVLFDHNKNILEIKGDSRPENTLKFYEPLIKWLEDYNSFLYWRKNQGGSSEMVDFDFNLEYFNSTSAKFILDMLQKLKSFNKNEKLFNVKWHYDKMDIGMKEAGEEFENMLDMKFEFISS